MGSYTYHDADDEEDYESEPEEGFSVDQYYVPFRVNNARTKRKPDAPFMAMFSMYASNRNVKTEEEHRNGHHEQPTVHSPILDGVEETEDDMEMDDGVDFNDDMQMQRGREMEMDGKEIMLNGHDEAANGGDSDMEMDVEEKGNNEEEEDMDRGTSPPLRSMVPDNSNHITTASGNPLDNLKERYYKQQLPPSLQPTESERVLTLRNGQHTEQVTD